MFPRYGVPRIVRLGGPARSVGAVSLAPGPPHARAPARARPGRHGVAPKCIHRPRAGRGGRQGANPRAVARRRYVTPASGRGPLGRQRGAPPPRASPARQRSAHWHVGHALRHRTCLAHAGSDAASPPSQSDQPAEHQRDAIFLELRRGDGAAAFSVCLSTSLTPMRCTLSCVLCIADSPQFNMAVQKVRLCASSDAAAACALT